MYQRCAVCISQTVVTANWVGFTPRDCYRSLNGFWNAYLYSHLPCFEVTPKSTETPNTETLGRAYSWMCSAPLGSSWLLCCQLMGCDSMCFCSPGPSMPAAALTAGQLLLSCYHTLLGHLLEFSPWPQSFWWDVL